MPDELKTWGRVWGTLGLAPRNQPSKKQTNKTTIRKNNRKINNSGDNRKTSKKINVTLVPYMAGPSTIVTLENGTRGSREETLWKGDSYLPNEEDSRFYLQAEIKR